MEHSFEVNTLSIWGQSSLHIRYVFVLNQVETFSSASAHIDIILSWIVQNSFSSHYLTDLMGFAFNTQVFHCSNFSITYTVFCRYKTCVINFLLYFFVWLLSKRAFMRIAIFVYTPPLPWTYLPVDLLVWQKSAHIYSQRARPCEVF